MGTVVAGLGLVRCKEQQQLLQPVQAGIPTRCISLERGGWLGRSACCSSLFPAATGWHVMQMGQGRSPQEPACSEATPVAAPVAELPGCCGASPPTSSLGESLSLVAGCSHSCRVASTYCCRPGGCQGKGWTNWPAHAALTICKVSSTCCCRLGGTGLQGDRQACCRARLVLVRALLISSGEDSSWRAASLSSDLVGATQLEA